MVWKRGYNFPVYTCCSQLFHFYLGFQEKTLRKPCRGFLLISRYSAHSTVLLAPKSLSKHLFLSSGGSRWSCHKVWVSFGRTGTASGDCWWTHDCCVPPIEGKLTHGHLDTLFHSSPIEIDIFSLCCCSHAKSLKHIVNYLFLIRYISFTKPVDSALWDIVSVSKHVNLATP